MERDEKNQNPIPLQPFPFWLQSAWFWCQPMKRSSVTKDTLYDTLKAIWTTSSQMVPAWVVFSLILAELGDWTMVLAEMFREKRRKDQEQRAQEERAQVALRGALRLRRNGRLGLSGAKKRRRTTSPSTNPHRLPKIPITGASASGSNRNPAQTVLPIPTSELINLTLVP